MNINNKPFCQVCKNAGKTIEEYSSHYIKNKPGPYGVVVCPTILNSECSYCHKKGHFKKYCGVLKAYKLFGK